MPIRVAIVDDKIQNRLPLAERLKSFSELDVVFTSANGRLFLQDIKQHADVQLVLMDIEMPEMDGIKTVELAAQHYPAIKFIMLTVFDDEDKIFEAIKAGACGYLLKDDAAGKIYKSIIEAVELGGAPMSPGIARKALSLLSKADVPVSLTSNPPEEISQRELEILKYLVNGFDYKAIAEKLFISPHTVRKHIGNIYHKLQVNSKAQAIRLAMKKRWV
jgi:DNA-binding NarL/FixJ family response regulator